MSNQKQSQPFPAPLGCIEPHAPLLRMPKDEQLLYKIMTVENLLRSITGNYLHFNRVDCYSDFPDADENDGEQLPKDQPTNEAKRFRNAPDFSAADYYNQSRARTYACCFSIENSDYIWKKYGNESTKGKVCVVFGFGKLRAMLNQILDPESATLQYNGTQCHQIFSINYGLVDYIDWDTCRINESRLPNPILYTYLKDKNRFSEEKELRISLSAFGIGQFALQDGTMIQFPPSLQLGFDFRSAIGNMVIEEILLSPGADSGIIKHELRKLRINTVHARAKT